MREFWVKEFSWNALLYCIPLHRAPKWLFLLLSFCIRWVGRGGLTSQKHAQVKDDADNRQQAERRNTTNAKDILYRCAFLQQTLQTCLSTVAFKFYWFMHSRRIKPWPCSTVWATRIDCMSHGLNLIQSNIFSNFHFHYVVWKYSRKSFTFYNLLFATFEMHFICLNIVTTF